MAVLKLHGSMKIKDLHVILIIFSFRCLFFSFHHKMFEGKINYYTVNFHFGTILLHPERQFKLIVLV